MCLCALDSDLQGYFSDGFIRPDEELVYTTSASDGSVENDLDNLRNPIPMMRSRSQEEGSVEEEDFDTRRPEPDLNQTRKRLVELDSSLLEERDQNRFNHSSNATQAASQHDVDLMGTPKGPGENSPENNPSKRKRTRNLSTELEKELASLQPFYYDK